MGFLLYSWGPDDDHGGGLVVPRTAKGSIFEWSLTCEM